MLLPSYYSFDPDGRDTCLKADLHQRQVQRYCDALHEEAQSELESYEDIQNVDKHIRYLMGKQWPEKRPSYKASPVANRIWSNFVQLISYLTDIRQSFEVGATNPQYNQTGDVLNKMARAWFVNQDVDMSVATILMYSALSTGYGRLVYNKNLDAGHGDIELVPCGPTEVIPIKPGQNLQSSQGVIYQKPMPLQWFREEYPVLGEMVPSDDRYSTFKVDRGDPKIPLLGPAFRRLFGQSNITTRQSVMPMGWYREFWLKDNRRNTSDVDVFVGNPNKAYGYRVSPQNKLYPRGRLICMGGPVVLYDGPNPFFHGRFPFADLRINKVPWQWPGPSEFRNQIPLQDIINSILAGILDMVKKAVNPPMAAPENAFSDAAKKNLDPNMPGVKLFYSLAGGTPPSWQNIAQLPSFVFDVMLFAKDELMNLAGFLDTGQVASKKIIPGADTLEQMREGQQTMVRLKVRHIETFFREIGEQWIANAFQFYNTARRVQMLGLEGLTWQDFDWNPGTMVPAGMTGEEHWRSFKWKIIPGSLLKSSRTVDQAKAMNLRRQGDLDRDNLLEILDMGNLKESIKKNLQAEGKDILLNMLRQKMSGTAGGGGLSPEAMAQITNATAEKPTAIQ